MVLEMVPRALLGQLPPTTEEDYKFKVSLGYLVSPCPNTNKQANKTVLGGICEGSHV